MVTERTASNGNASAEQARLDAAIRRADELLVDSLRRDEGRRVRRRTALLVTGGLLMTALVCVLLLTFAGPRKNDQLAGPMTKPADADAQRAKTLSAEGWRLWQQLEPARAEAKFVESVALDPTQPHAWNGLGWSRFNQGKSAEAVEPFEKALALEPDHGGASNGLGQVYLAQGKLNEAERPLLRAAGQEASPAFWGLTKLYLLRGDYDRALPWALLIVRDVPGNPDARELLEAARTHKLNDKLRKQIEPASKS
jgi:Flp pilus assembly protein TadD